MLRPLLLVTVLLAPLAACGTSGARGTGAANGDAAAPDGGKVGGSICAITRDYVTRCAGDDELNCGAAGFDAWCAANDEAVNSDAYRRAETKCLPEVACESSARRACEYGSYADETPTAAQSALVLAYCRTCEPADVAGCTTRSTTYDAGAGPSVVGDIFIAAWELSDPICDLIREKCTGGALDAGASMDAAACASAFASCAAGPYLDAVPDCP